MFILEAIKAKHGDCLLLHWGTASDSRMAVIDGGPNTIYADFLKPRLVAIAKERKVTRIKLDLTMVSHIDDDHINGLLDLAEEIESGDAPAEIGVLWHNSLEGLLGEKFTDGSTAKVTAAIGAHFPQMEEKWASKVLASVPQGQELHAFAKRRGITDKMNSPFPKVGNSDHRLVMADKNPVKIKGLSLTVVGPMGDEVEKLRKKWVELRDDDAMAAFSDPSPYNLSSIVVLAEFGKKNMLLTGDARGDIILEGLEKGNLLKNGKIHVNLLKLPHHGSQNNVTSDFFKKVTADVYVVSGDNVKFPNPHKKAMTWLAEARGTAKYEVYCTYDLDYMRDIFGKRLRFPDNDASFVQAKLS
jgi:hypothetical protein